MRKTKVADIYDTYFKCIGEQVDDERTKKEFLSFLNLRMREAWRKFNWNFAMRYSSAVVLDEGFVPIEANSDLDDGDKFQIFARDPKLRESQPIAFKYYNSNIIVNKSDVLKWTPFAKESSQGAFSAGEFYLKDSQNYFASSESELVKLTGSIKFTELLDGEFDVRECVVKKGDIFYENQKYYGAIMDTVSAPSLEGDSYVEITGKIRPNVWLYYKAITPEFTYGEVFETQSALVCDVFKSYLIEAARACYLAARARPEEAGDAQARANAFLNEEIFRQARDNSEMY